MRADRARPPGARGSPGNEISHLNWNRDFNGGTLGRRGAKTRHYWIISLIYAKSLSAQAPEIEFRDRVVSSAARLGRLSPKIPFEHARAPGRGRWPQLIEDDARAVGPHFSPALARHSPPIYGG
ncbi:hypothetical protein EVAR_31433_1 [Eumeta japonica]|uniref:Uncharacterized protein n=1 Tax=Eumeta variegata TaxID=151549 RepID=A0A4C1UXW9_EUMVA|nr:hypothetical protein EVAR_31433_1 [Eumeta japonica]